jgi:hypothetical protein
MWGASTFGLDHVTSCVQATFYPTDDLLGRPRALDDDASLALKLHFAAFVRREEMGSVLSERGRSLSMIATTNDPDPAGAASLIARNDAPREDSVACVAQTHWTNSRQA